MDKENKSVDGVKEDRSPMWWTKILDFKRREEAFPPERSLLVPVFFLSIVLILVYIAVQFCSIHENSWLIHSSFKEVFRPCPWGTYVAFGILIVILTFSIYKHHDLQAHDARLVDRSEAEALFAEANNAERRLDTPEKPENYKEKKEQLNNEVERLKKLGFKGWTEYQTLPLSQLLVDFHKTDELKAIARSSLIKLQEYAVTSTSRYDHEYYNKLEERINDAIDKIYKEGDDPERDKASEELRAELKIMLEDTADYDYLWTEGSTIITSIRMCGVTAIFPLIVMGLLPILHPLGDKIIGILNWGLLGISGAITSVLWSLKKSDYVEVGSTEGKKELWRAVLGIGLGFVAGVLLYSMILGEILGGNLFPDLSSNLEKPEDIDIARSIFWAIASGFSLELVFDRLRGASDEIS